MKTSNRFLIAAPAAFVLAVALSACTTTREEEIRADLTPELETLHERQADMDNAGALMADENGRMFVEDLGRVFYTNRPSRLTPEPMPRP